MEKVSSRCAEQRAPQDRRRQTAPKASVRLLAEGARVVRSQINGVHLEQQQQGQARDRGGQHAEERDREHGQGRGRRVERPSDRRRRRGPPPFFVRFLAESVVGETEETRRG